MGRDEAGSVAGWRDGTGREQGGLEHERLLAPLRRERDLLQAVLRHLPAGVAIVEAASRQLLFRNTQADAILGPPGSGDDIAAAYRGLRPAHADGRPYAEEDLPLTRALAGEVVAGEEIHLDGRADTAAGTVVSVVA